jgi:hypothetical protein
MRSNNNLYLKPYFALMAKTIFNVHYVLSMWNFILNKKLLYFLQQLTTLDLGLVAQLMLPIE